MADARETNIEDKTTTCFVKKSSNRACPELETYSPLKSSRTSPNFLIALASLKSPVAGSLVRLKATALTRPVLTLGPVV
jgi:hypothetical protein